MRYKYFMTTMWLVGLGACSSQQGSVSQQEGPTPKAVQAMTVSSAKVPPSRIRAKHAEAAAAALDTLAEHNDHRQPGNRDFASAAEVKSATLSDPIPLFMVGLNNLSLYRRDRSAQSLLIDKQEFMYPVAVNGEVRSAVVVRRRADNQWEPVELGHASLVKEAHTARQALAAKRRIAETSLSLVDIPTLGVRFFAHEENGVLFLTPLRDVPGTSLRAGVTQNAAEVFTLLQPLAASVDPNMPS